MEIGTEIRKLPPSNIRELSQILELNDSWKKLMAIIPKVLEKNNYECNIAMNNLHKYHSEHFKIIENAADRLRSCTEILFDEWGTSGRVRPALGHLLHLLVKAELFRAADYVAENLLNIDRPSRPTDGPAAAVQISALESDSNIQDVENLLNEINYPSSVIANIMESYSNDVNLYVESSNIHDDMVKVIPKIIVSEIATSNSNMPFVIPVVTERQRPSLTRQNASTEENNDISDMIMFSQTPSNVTSEECSGIVPNISNLMGEVSNTQNYTTTEDNTSSTLQSEYTNLVPNISNLIQNIEIDNHNSNLMEFSSTLSNISSETQTSNIELPNVSALNITSESVILENDDVPAFSNLLCTSTSEVERNMPDIYVLNSDIESNSPELPQISALLSDNPPNQTFSSKQFIPISLDYLGESTSDTSNFSTSKLSTASSESSGNSRQNCVSPLPNLSLNTELPHFSYEELLSATNNFDETPHKNCKQVENQLAETNGRFLGSGAFGSVYLALNLISNKPVAVKKLFLKDVDVVNVDDTITKQFRNEVEVLSKYNHNNLLSLVGYSSDGPTYCLLYEFIPGGALKDRLQENHDVLQWIDRLHIALGTAKAIAYLHTAYSTPLIHRDIKTANILLDCSKRPKLCDFGLIKLVPNQNTNTSTSAFGTSAYMAREAFRGDVSVKLDTFSYGVVLLELITGLPPLDENRAGYDIVTHVDEVCEDTGILPLIDERAGNWTVNNTNIAVELYNISVKCLEENKRKRPTMVEVTDMLQELFKQIL